jgi:6,7-dimethyl-8-ribityllumazine synthase
MSANAPSSPSIDLPASSRVAIAASRWNPQVIDLLLGGCVDRLKQLGLDESRIELRRVPGAFELPVAAKLLADTKRFDAIILIGCVIRGETAHFEIVANEAARGIQQVAVATGIPCILGVLAVETLEQAIARAGGVHGHAGIAAADAAAEMIVMARSLKR